MTAKRNVRKTLRRLLCSRRGTAEIIGSVMFLLIMMFFFTNVFLWHDRATREIDGVLSERMNSLVNIEWRNDSDLHIGESMYCGTLYVGNTGGVATQLSRLWITEATDPLNHDYFDLEGGILQFAAGDAVQLQLFNSTEKNVEYNVIYYQWTSDTIFKILTTHGNMAACKHDFSG